ncbi:MAG: tRNA (cytidine(34)-2'-O)-methyltransferase [Clostridia bacterium]
MNIVLVEPEIPQNTGNIARTCSVTGTALHLVRPLGFSVEDRHLKRAGLDYWDGLAVQYYDSIGEVLEKYAGNTFHFASTKAIRRYDEAVYGPDDFLVFGKETKGLDETLLRAHYSKCIRLPMQEGKRSLNLSSAVAVILYEALRQNDFKGLKERGVLGNES